MLQPARHQRGRVETHPRNGYQQLWRGQRGLAGRTAPAEHHRICRKTTLDYARTNLRPPRIAEGEYLTVFGQYIIKPEVFDFLENNIRNNLRERGEFQLTSALDRLRQTDGFLGLVIDGRRFDIGIPEHYLETLQEFRPAVRAQPSASAASDFLRG